MTEGGYSNGAAAPRLRIKGRAASVLRFFSISVAFMILWILVTSQLGHYSKLFGPQILLQLNLAFYLPSIPVLLLSGSLERALDERLGPIGSIAIRINTGLGGCLLLAALFPLLPGLRPGDGPLWPLLTAVAVLGSLSAVAFSTSYQLVQFFRAADTIGLGVGCVGAGPLVLLVQLALEVGPSPARWQWIAMYEICAGFTAAGLASSVSLCGQYWSLLNDSASRGAAAAAAAAGDGDPTVVGAPCSGSGADDDNSGRMPLLMAADLADEEAGRALGRFGSGGAGGGGRLSRGGGGGGGSPLSPYGMRPYGSGGLRVRAGRPLTLRPSVAPDPSNVFTLLSPGPDGRLGWAADEEDDSPPLLLRRAVSAGVDRAAAASLAAARRREALAAAGLDRSHGGVSRTGGTSLASKYLSLLRQAKPSTPPPSPEVPAAGTAAAAAPAATETAAVALGAAAASTAAGTVAGTTAHTPLMQALLAGMASAPPAVGFRSGQRHPGGADTPGTEPPTADGDDGGGLEFGVPDAEPVVQPAIAVTPAPPLLGEPLTPLPYSGGGGGGADEGRYSSFATPAASTALQRSLFEPSVSTASGITITGGGEGLQTGRTEGAVEELLVESCTTATLTVRQEVAEVVRGAWPVLLGFLVSVTTLYIVFPFFTYVPASGWLGDSLPQVLFYARLFTDLTGRLLPRVRALQLRSGPAVMALAGVSTVSAALMFIYILAPAAWGRAVPGLLRNDLVPVALVVALWLAGGYTNTISNMLAPAMVPPELAGRASAVMALLFNVGHIGGLFIAAAMAAGIFGDVVG